MPYRAGPEPHHHLPAVQSFHRRSDQWRRDGPSALQRWVDSSLTPSSLSIRYPRTSFQRSAVVTALIRAGGISLSPAIVIGYIMWTYDNTLAFVQSRRYCVSPISVSRAHPSPIYLPALFVRVSGNRVLVVRPEGDKTTRRGHADQISSRSS
jgi:hypothetical protein